MPRLAGKTALVTGAGGGIGKAIARRFGAEGAAVMCLDLDTDTAARTASEIVEAGGRAAASRCDVAQAEQVREGISLTVSTFGALQIAVNTAATYDPDATVVELEEQDWKATLDVNLTGVFLVCKHAIPKIAASGGGSVVIVASQLGQVVIAKRPGYVTSKAALIQLARAMAIDHARDGVRVNTISPGAIETARLEGRFGSMERARQILAPLHPVGRLGQPGEIAAGALFLASDESSFMTGADLVMDGGYTCV